MNQVRYIDTLNQLAGILTKDLLRVTDETDFSDCSILWMYLFSRAAIFVAELKMVKSCQSATCWKKNKEKSFHAELQNRDL